MNLKKIEWKKFNQLFYELIHLCKLFPLRTLLTFLLIASTSLSIVILPFLLKLIIENLSANKIISPYNIVVWIVLYGAAWTVKDVTEQLREIVFIPSIHTFLKNFVLRMFRSVFDSYQYERRLDVGQFFDCIIRLRDSFNGLVWGMVFYILPTLIELTVGCCIIHIYFGWNISILILISMVLFTVFTLRSMKKSVKYQKATHDASGKSNNYLIDRLQNIISVLIHGKKEHEAVTYEKYLNIYTTAQIKKIIFFEKTRLGQGLIIGISLTITILCFFYTTVPNQYSVSDFVMLNAYLIQFLSPLSYMGRIMEDIRDGFINFQDATTYLRVHHHFKLRLRLNNTFQKLTLENIAYKINNKTILHHITLELCRGMKILIIGPSGAGKSTLLRLISKLILPTEGKIILNNQDITNANLNDAIQFVSYLPQETSLFEDTIFYNTSYSDLNLPSQESYDLLKKISFFRSDSANSSTYLEQSTSSLSGGERQKVLIARSLLENRDLIILDEPFSALDELSIINVMHTLMSDKKDKTIVIASHKIIDPSKFDLIICIENGTIQAKGNHEQMLIQSSYYKSVLT